MDKEKNLELYLKKLSQLGVDVSNVSDNFKELLMNASFVPQDDFGNAHKGSLLEIVLRVLTPYAIKLNEMLPAEVQVDKNELIKICMLHHISKAIRMVPNDNEWEMQKLKKMFKYDENQPSIKTGLHSAVLAAQEFSVPITAEFMEAMTINDRDLSDNQARFHCSTMASIVRMANEMTYIQINQKKQ